MASYASIRSGIAANLTAHISGWEISAYMLAQPIPPAIDIKAGESVYDLAMRRGLDELTMVVRAFVPLSTTQGAEVNLDALRDTAGSSSLKAAVESDGTLGGVAQWARVVSASEDALYEFQGIAPLLGCEFTVQVGV